MRGNPYDNAKAESLMKTLKVEAVYLMAYETFEDVTADLPRFIIVDETGKICGKAALLLLMLRDAARIIADMGDGTDFRWTPEQAAAAA
jgi:hypothetical protein